MPIAADQSPAQNTKRRRAPFILGAIVLLAAAGWWIWLWTQRAPEAARLLPESDAVIYVNLRPLRLASLFASLPPVKPDSGYASFIQATSFRFERDLDAAAIAVHLPRTSSGSGNLAADQGPIAGQARFSEVFIGRFDVARLTAWLRKNSSHTEQMQGHEIFVLPVEDRTVRVAVISSRLMLVTNSEDVDALRQMLRNSAALSAPEGPHLVRKDYKDVPAGSLAWALAQPGKNLPLPNGLEIPIPAGTTWVASVRYAGEIQLQAQALTASDDDARQVAESLGTLLALFRSIQANTQPRGPDADVKAFFDSLEVHQDKNRAVVTAEMPAGFVQKLVNGMAK